MNRLLVFLIAFAISSPALADGKIYTQANAQQLFKIISDNANDKKHDQGKIREFACSVIGNDCDLENAETALAVYKVAENKYLISAMDEGASFNHMYELILVKKTGDKIAASSLEDFSYYDAKTKKFIVNDAPQGFTNLSYDNGLFHTYFTGDSQGYCRRDIYYAFNAKTDRLDIVKITETNECDAEKGKAGKVKTVTIYKK